MLPNGAGRVGETVIEGTRRAWSSIRTRGGRGGSTSRFRSDGHPFAAVSSHRWAVRTLGAVSTVLANATGRRLVRGLQALLDEEASVGPRGGTKCAVEDRFSEEPVVSARTVPIVLATIAATADSGDGRNEGRGDRSRPVGTTGGTAPLGRRLRENGPVVLVPLAWSFATAAHLGVLRARTVLIGHIVMDAVLTAFAAASWSEMTEGVLRAWKLVLLVGLGFTLSGTVALLGTPEQSADVPSADRASAETGSTSETALSLTVLSWMLIPAAGLAYTGLHVDENDAPRVYLAGAVCSVLGAVAYASAPSDAPADTRRLLGLALANAGQTAGIVNAVYQ